LPVVSVPRATLSAAMVAEIVALAEPSKDADPVTSPERAMVLAVASAVAEVALPLKDAVIVPALKFPDASLATIVDAVFAEVAFEVTVNVTLSLSFAVNVADPLSPVPDVASVRVPSLAGSTAVVDTAVTSPFAFTVIVGMLLPLPKVPTLLLTVANVVTVFAEVISPERFGILVVVVAVPARVAVIVPALKFPDPSLATMVEFVLLLVALDVTVNVEAPDPLYVVEPDKPVPLVFIVKVFRLLPRETPEIVELAR
jgi:hypothetical protein